MVGRQPSPNVSLVSLRRACKYLYAAARDCKVPENPDLVLGVSGTVGDAWSVVLG